MLKGWQKQAKAKRGGVINPQNYNVSQFYTENVDALIRYEPTQVDCRTWLHVPSWTPWSTSSDTHQVVKIRKRYLLTCICIHHFDSNVINNKDHMRISSTFVLNPRQWSIANSNRDFYWELYTIFNRIKFTIWTICAFRVLNLHQWSLAKTCSKKSWKVMTKKGLNKLKPKGMV